MAGATPSEGKYHENTALGDERRAVGIRHQHDIAEFPADWFEKAQLAVGRPDCSLNYFGVRASVPLRVWIEKGWIHPDDPRGWFQWYCRYYSGRRMPGEDHRQIARWRAFRRHAAQVRKNCEPGDPFCRPKQRQALLHWAYDSRDI